MTGAGNDFVLIDNRRQNLRIKWPDFAPRACNRKFGVGADGLLVLERSSIADCRMEYFNADGSYGGMCGNGARCLARYVMSQAGREDLYIEALGYIYRAEVLGTQISLEMKEPNSLIFDKQLSLFESKIIGHYVDTGAPHFVVFASDLPNNLGLKLEAIDVDTIGRGLRNHPQFAPEGTNVDFVELVSKNRIAMRTFERGVECETLACGTGAIASSVVTSLVAGLGPPMSVNCRSGEVLKVSFDKIGKRINNVRLRGNASLLFSGVMFYNLTKRQLSG